MLFFVCTKAGESLPVQLETSRKYSDTFLYDECSLT